MPGEVSRSYEGPDGPEWDAARKAMDDFIKGGTLDGDDLVVEIRCPDCGDVRVHADVFEHGEDISAICPGCNERLYFAPPGEIQ